ncbi:MAG: ferritin family protein [Alphaproteobacteria bacterium]
MPKFAKIKGVMTPKRPMGEIEILRAIKFAIASEFEAIQIYEQIIESTDNITVKKALAEITKDEKQHAGGLYHLLEILSPGDAAEYKAGAEETKEIIA